MVSHNTKKALTIAGAGLATLAGSSVLSSNVSADAVAPDTTDVTNTTTDTPQAQHEAALKALDEAKERWTSNPGIKWCQKGSWSSAS